MDRVSDEKTWPSLDVHSSLGGVIIHDSILWVFLLWNDGETVLIHTPEPSVGDEP